MLINRYALLLMMGFITLACNQDCENDVGIVNNDINETLKSSASIQLKYAKGFTVEDTDYGYLVTVFHPEDSSQVFKYKFAEKSKITTAEDVFELPLKQMACLSTTHIPMFAKLNAYNAISGVAYSQFISDSIVHQLIESGEIMSLQGSEAVDAEKLLVSKSEYLMVYPYEGTVYNKYKDYGVRLIYNAEYAEKHPLGKAEWIKFVGLLVGKSAEANQLFDRIERQYNDVLAKLKHIKHRPTVFTGSYFKGMWNAPSGNSLVAKLISDAGATYVFEHRQERSNLVFDKETFLQNTLDADYWGRVAASDQLKSWPLDREVLETFKAYKSRHVFACDANATDYFGKGTIEPHYILNDLAAIFHPHLFADYNPVYFKQLAEDFYNAE